MKKLSILIVSLLMLFAGNADAQKKYKDGGSKPAFDVGSKTLGVFLGFGVSYTYDYGYYYTYGDYHSSVMPCFGVIYDQGIIGHAGPGTIGVGGVLTYKASTNRYYEDRDHYNSVIAGVRATYHLTLLKEKSSKFDPYGGVTIGLRFSRYSNNYSNDTENDVRPIAGLFVGAKYNFAKNFGAFAELGYDVSIFKIGLNVNLQ